MSTRKFKLLKDLPDVKAGTIISNFTINSHGQILFTIKGHCFNQTDMENNREWFEEIFEEIFKVGDIVCTITGFLFKIIDIVGLNLYYQKQPEWRYWDNDGTCRLANRDEIISYYNKRGWIKGAKVKWDGCIWEIDELKFKDDGTLLVMTTTDSALGVNLKNCELIKEPDYPKSWKELKHSEGYFIEDRDCSIGEATACETLFDRHKDIYATKKQDLSGAAFPKLIQLHKDAINRYNKHYNCNWESVFSNKDRGSLDNIFVIDRDSNDNLSIEVRNTVFHPLPFPTKDLAEKFLKYHRTLLEQYYQI